MGTSDTPPPRPPSLSLRAAENIDFIRRTMERAESFRALPTSGGVLMGVTAILTAALASQAETPLQWLLIWLCEAFLAGAIGLHSLITQSRRRQLSVFGAPARRFILALTPGLAAGALLTIQFHRHDLDALLPGLWLLLYGAATLSAGLHSVKQIPLMGLCLMLMGAVTFWLPPAWGNVMLALGFGVVQIAFGAYLWRKYDR